VDNIRLLESIVCGEEKVTGGSAVGKERKTTTDAILSFTNPLRGLMLNVLSDRCGSGQIRSRRIEADRP